MNGNQQIDFNIVFNYMFLMVFIVMMFKMVDKTLEAPKPKMLYPGKIPPGYKPVHHSSGGISGQYGTCYEDAWRFLIKAEEGELVHGSVTGADGRTVKHAWVELPTGFIWEPETGTFIRIDNFNAAFKPEEEARYSVTQAAIMAARTGNHGPWTEEERKAIVGYGEIRERIVAGADVR